MCENLKRSGGREQRNVLDTCVAQFVPSECAEWRWHVCSSLSLLRDCYQMDQNATALTLSNWKPSKAVPLLYILVWICMRNGFLEMSLMKPKSSKELPRHKIHLRNIIHLLTPWKLPLMAGPQNHCRVKWFHKICAFMQIQRNSLLGSSIRSCD